MTPQEITCLENEIASKLNVPTAAVCMVGSTLICGKGNDQDFLCLVPDHDAVEKAGFASDVEVQYESALHSFRNGGVNIIAVTDIAFFAAEVAIAHGAKMVKDFTFDMSKRDDRVAFHSIARRAVTERLAKLNRGNK